MIKVPLAVFYELVRLLLRPFEGQFKAPRYSARYRSSLRQFIGYQYKRRTS